MTSVILILLAGVIIACLFYAGARTLQNHPSIGLLISGGIIMTVWELPSPPPLFSAFGFNVFMLDIVSALFAVSSVFSLCRLGSALRGTRFSWAAFLFLIFVSIVFGIISFGPNTALNEVRGVVYLLCSTVWAVSISWERADIGRLFHRYSLGLGWGLVILALYHAMRYGVGGAADFIDADGIEQTGRILVSGQAMVLGLASLVAFAHWVEKSSKVSLLCASVFAFVVVIAQDRSVWAALGVGFILLFMRMDRVRRPAAFIYILGVASAALVLVGAGFARDGIQQLANSASNASTYNARMFSWSYLTNSAIDRGLTTILFGQPFGTGFARIEPNGNFVTFQPHNIYVSIFLRTGAVGLGLYLISICIPFVRRLVDNSSTLKAALIASVLVYGWAYGPTWYVHVFLGFSIVGPALPRPQRGNRPLVVEGTRPPLTLGHPS